MSHLVVLNGSGAIARSVVKSHLANNVGKYASVRLVDARPFRQSVYNWQRSLDQNVTLQKSMARSVQSIDLALEGAQEVLYFTHDYYTMSSDKNSHIQAAAQLVKKHGVSKFVAVCPVEQDLAWSEDEKNFQEKASEAEAAALQTNPSLTLLKSNIAFGPESYLVHYLAQCALVGKSPYKNLVSPDNKFEFAPIHTSDIAEAVGSALNSSGGWFSLNGPQKLNLRQMMDCIEESAGRSPGQTKGPLFPPMNLLWEFMYGTGADQNMSRLVEFYESNSQINLGVKPWTATSPQIEFGEFYQKTPVLEEDYASPTIPSYKLQHTD